MLDLSAATPEQFSVAHGVSEDGSVVVGTANFNGNPTSRAFRWTEGTGLVSLGGLTAEGYSLAYGVSLDGEVIVGEAASVPPAPGEYSKPRAFRWTDEGGMVDLGGLEPNASYSSAQATNGDGSVVVGLASSGFTETHAFRWEAGVMQDIGALDGDRLAMATAVSADGNVVVGISSNVFVSPGNSGPLYDNASRAFRWTAATEIQDLNTLAADAGVDTTGVTMISAIFISADGTLISGAALTTESPDERTAYTLRYEDSTTGADVIDAEFVDLSFGSTDEGSGGGTDGGTDRGTGGGSGEGTGGGAGGSTGGGSDVSITTLTETQARASLDAAGQSLGTAAGQSNVMVELALNRYGSWATPQGYDLTGFATSGGFGSGIRGYAELAEGVILYGGIAFAQPDFDDVGFGSETLGALALRFDTTEAVPTGPGGSSFVEMFGSLGQIDDLVLTRTYATSGGMGMGVGQTSGELSTLGLRAGLLFEAGERDQFGFAATVGQEWLSTDAFTEVASAGNPFPASFAEGSSIWTVVSLDAQWAHAITPAMDLTLTAGWNQAFAADDGLTAGFTGIGNVAGSAAGEANWFDFGGGLTYQVNGTADVSLVVGGISGTDDTSAQGFGSLSVTFFF